MKSGNKYSLYKKIQFMPMIKIPCVKFLQSHPTITETFRFCLIVYLYNMFQPSTGSSSGTKLKFQVGYRLKQLN
jgi:hypothetical protein